MSLHLRITRRAVVGLLVAGVALGSAARAEAAGLGPVDLTPSFETAGVIVQLTGDSGNETVVVEVKGPGDADFHAAHPTVLFEPHALATSLFDLAPDTDYDVRVTLADPDGVSGSATQVLKLHTRAEATLPAPTRVRWVGPGGTRRGHRRHQQGRSADLTPTYALAHALPGDEIRVLAGTYPATSTDGLHGTEVARRAARRRSPTHRPGEFQWRHGRRRVLRQRRCLPGHRRIRGAERR